MTNHPQDQEIAVGKFPQEHFNLKMARVSRFLAKPKNWILQHRPLEKLRAPKMTPKFKMGTASRKLTLSFLGGSQKRCLLIEMIFNTLKEENLYEIIP